MRTFYNMIMIIILGSMSVTTSLFISPVDFSSSIYLEEESQSVREKYKVSLITEDGSYLVNPETMTLKLTFTEKVVFETPPDHLFEVNIFQDGKVIRKSLVNLETNYIKIEKSAVFNKDDSIIASIDISSDRLSLTPGVYKMIISTSFPDEITSNNLEIAVEYSSTGKYMISTSNLPVNTTGVRIYYANKNNDLLIPVTRFVAYNALKHDLAEELYSENPKENGLRNPVNKINYIISRENIIYIDVPENDPVYDSDIKEAENAYYAFIKTMFSIE